MKYCENTTYSHPISNRFKNQIELLNTIFKSEGCTTIFFSDEKAINLDEVEIELCTNNSGRQATMDLAVGISRVTREADKTIIKNAQMLLVELKFNIKNPINIKKSDLEAKIKHSMEILGQEIPIHNLKILIFDDKQISVAKAWIARIFGKSPKPIISVRTANELKVEYFNG